MGTSDYKILKQCPLCETQYTERSVKIIEQKAESELVHMTCIHCKHAILACIVKSRHGVSSVGMLTDLQVEDVQRLHKKSPLHDNDVLDFHTTLKHFPSTFIHLFS